jgi:hypothetical protein
VIRVVPLKGITGIIPDGPIGTGRVEIIAWIADDRVPVYVDLVSSLE